MRERERRVYVCDRVLYFGVCLCARQVRRKNLDFFWFGFLESLEKREREMGVIDECGFETKRWRGKKKLLML